MAPDASEAFLDLSFLMPDLSGAAVDLSGGSPDVSGTDPGFSFPAPDMSGTPPDLSPPRPDLCSIESDSSGEAPELSGADPDSSDMAPDLSWKAEQEDWHAACGLWRAQSRPAAAGHDQRENEEVSMQLPLEISTRRIDLSSDLEADLRRRATKLERLYDRITSCRIAVERPSEHHNEGGPYRVRLDITVPGSELVADKQGEDLNLAIRDAFQAAERQIEELAQRRRGEVKTPAGQPEGRERLFEEPQEGPAALVGEEG